MKESIKEESRNHHQKTKTEEKTVSLGWRKVMTVIHADTYEKNT